MLHPHDQASRLPGYGGKLGIDATCKASGVHADDDLWHNKVTILPVEDDAAQVPDPHGVHPILVLVDADVDPTEPMTIARHVLSSVDWSRDLTIYPDGSVMVDARRRSKSLPARLS
jgi:3-polyprenyl-4-hydroxybenzoate decarboxylase